MEIQNNLSSLRKTRGLGVARLAAHVGVSRQTIYAIEAGTYVPNTIVSLRLAQALETSVEAIFQIEKELDAPATQTADVCLLGNPSSLSEGQLLRIVKVNGKLVAVVPDPASWGVQPGEAAFLAPIRGGKGKPNARVKLLSDSFDSPSRILLAGCDPSATLLANALHRQGFELVIAFENSLRAVELLQEGLVHIAGSHLAEKADSKVDLQAIIKRFPRNSTAIFSYAMWKEGLVVAPGNPKRIAAIGDLARHNVTITNREPGAGCRRLLDDSLKRAGIDSAAVRGYDRVTLGQLPAGRLVQSGEVDCCINTQAAARSMGLAFISLAEKPYLLVLRRANLRLPPFHALIQTLGRSAYRREVKFCVGYDMQMAGERLV